MRLKVYREDVDGVSGWNFFSGPTTDQLGASIDFAIDASGIFRYQYYLTAEAKNYAFILFGVSSGGAETYIAGDLDIVAGDVFYINGQSNAEGKPFGSTSWTNPIVYGPDWNKANTEAGTNRNFVRTFGGGVNPALWTWGIGDANADYNSDHNTGQFGMRIGARIVSEHNMPVCIINGAELGNPISYFQRNDLNKYDLTTNYGRELTRLNAAGLVGGIRAIIWFHGESNTFTGGNALALTTAQYFNAFSTLAVDWEQDFGNADKYYMIQIKPGCGGGNNAVAASEIQQAELNISNSFNGAKKEMQIVSTNNINQAIDNCHYNYEIGQRVGYREIGDRVTSLIKKDFYSYILPDNSLSPEPLSATFTARSSPTVASQVTMYFKRPTDDLAVINAPGGDIKSLIRLKGGNYNITSATIVNTATPPAKNFVLRVNFTPVGVQPNPTAIGFLSPEPGSVSPIPAITAGGAEGIGLVNFNNLTITQGILPVDPLNLRISSNSGKNSLTWEASDNDKFDYFEVERSETGTDFTPISNVQGSHLVGKGTYQYTDTKPNSIRNYYRIKAVQLDGKVIYSQEVAINNRTSSLIGISVYPNPVTDRANVSVTTKKAGNATLQIFDGSGKMISTRKINLLKGNNMFSAGEILDHSAGIYNLRVITDEEVFNTRVVRVK
ncbi:sialate O-acetylesterase [Flavihumibacter fluvii]|uniref:sialate O-acetylesterase n=1 Tax=Flavihumibacter fluvii TaxID=2838157 RepID=UPI001BDEB825|nr:sialate O-acetylesterase [Flavihumibacter fluvii]ULQ54446.1 T9SS type A sorting domain-containing protein [Flavihumibacter fluvii]